MRTISVCDCRLHSVMHLSFHAKSMVMPPGALRPLIFPSFHSVGSAGRKKILFASFGLAKEGLDIPRLDRLFLVSPQKDYAVVTQSIGRIARKAEGKNDAVCYDYVDDIQFCENQFKRRKTHYRKAGCIL